jgi:predicted O-methyltransferase YrrM
MSIFRKKLKPVNYIVETIEVPQHLLAYDSAWRGLESIIKDLVLRFKLDTKHALEFGVEFGYSSVALSNYFDQVTGVDIFTGDVHAGLYNNHYENTSKRLAPFPNIKLIQADYRDFIKNNNDFYDLIHVDIIHDYKHTYECGLWAAQHSKCTIFHDTVSFKEVKRAVGDIAKKTNKTFYNYPRFFGLGIIA